MFDDIERMFGGGENTIRIPISIPLDDDGNLDRLCPHSQCRCTFKVLFEDWEAKVSDERAYCPLCRHEADPTQFNTPELDEYVGDIGLAYAAGLIDDAMSRMAREFNVSQRRNDFISINMSYEPNARPVLMPPQAAEQMRQTFECERCSCHYSSVGAAFFCPACGHNSARSTFDQTIVVVRKTLASIDDISATIAEKVDSDTAKDFVRETLESAIGRLISAFQRLAEAVFDEHPNRAQFKPRRNVFQNLDESSDLWQQAGESRYDHVLDAKEYAELVALFQRRHILEHREGIVDQAYINNSGDNTYLVGQRVVIKRHDVERLACLIEKLAAHLQS